MALFVITYRMRRRLRMLFLFFMLAGVLMFAYTRLKKLMDEFSINERKYDTLIAETASKYCIDSRLLKAVIWQESRFNSDSKGSKGEIGLMQLKPSAAVQDWANSYSVELPCEGVLFEPKLNIEIGAWYLSRAIKKWQDYKYCEELALSEYNAGRSRAEKWKPDNKYDDVIDRIKIESTRDYVQSIMNKYFEYCNGRARRQ